MAFFGRVLGVFSTVTHFATECSAPLKQVMHQGWSSLSLPWQRTQVRGRYVNWLMLRDVKRRQLVKEYGPMRLRVNAIRKNTIIPREIQEMADKQIAAFPRDSCRNRTTIRCVLSSRPRGNLRRWRLSRIMWRNLADYNKLSGVTRASW
ncbi:hypothetical protein NP493_1199g02027 [Ridgeia piscesae]|uniref:28S ribosomal protein S14, mitochondrial n=1 Tax=Ridgeia piscesae TaxID=27915 RepID=A0AAD9KCN6_RIDPI|nr:hypothetical protein NP493_1199g02027 [Ridgeia piscesae]